MAFLSILVECHNWEISKSIFSWKPKFQPNCGDKLIQQFQKTMSSSRGRRGGSTYSSTNGDDCASVQENQMTNLESGSSAKTVLAGFMLLAQPFLITCLTLSLPLTTYSIYARSVWNLHDQKSHIPPI